MGKLMVMNETGDVRVSWNPSNEDEVKNAQEHFNLLKEKGHIFFRIKKGSEDDSAKGDTLTEFDGTAGEIICEFDPKAEKIMASKPPVGG